MRICISEWQFTINVFHSFNHIKVKVPTSYIVKNEFVSIIGEEHSESIHSLFEQLEYDLEISIHTIVNLYKKRIITKDEYKKNINSIIVPDPLLTVDYLRTLFKEYNTVRKMIENNPYGSLLEKYFNKGHEVLSLCLIPLGYKAMKTNQTKIFLEFLRTLVAYGIRKQKISFNSMKFQTPISSLMNDLLTDRKTFTIVINELKTHLINWLPTPLDDTSFIMQLCEQQYSGKHHYRAKGMYLYLIECTDTHEATFVHDNIQLDHIYPKNPSAKISYTLEDPTLKFNLGNLTPFSGQNTKAGMQGNMSLSNKEFSIKVGEYKKSNIKITKELAKYERFGFADAQIEERSVEIATMLSQLTAKDLGLPK